MPLEGQSFGPLLANAALRIALATQPLSAPDVK